jgi:hypothetical protein
MEDSTRRPLDTIQHPIAEAVRTCETILEQLRSMVLPQKDPQAWLIEMMKATALLKEAHDHIQSVPTPG